MGSIAAVSGAGLRRQEVLPFRGVSRQREGVARFPRLPDRNGPLPFHRAAGRRVQRVAGQASFFPGSWSRIWLAGTKPARFTERSSARVLMALLKRFCADSARLSLKA